VSKVTGHQVGTVQIREESARGLRN